MKKIMRIGVLLLSIFFIAFYAMGCMPEENNGDKVKITFLNENEYISSGGEIFTKITPVGTVVTLYIKQYVPGIILTGNIVYFDSSVAHETSFIVVATDGVEAETQKTFKAYKNTVNPGEVSVTITTNTSINYNSLSGGTVQLSAEVQNASDDTVTFSIVQQNGSYAGITSSGLVTISSSVTDGYKFTVKAVSNFDNAKFDIKEFTVSKTTDPGSGVITFTSKDIYLINGDFISASAPSGTASFSLKNPVTGVTINSSSGLLAVGTSVADKTRITVVATAGSDSGEKEFIILQNASNAFFDNFKTGVSQTKWLLSNQAWGGAPNNGGCAPANINYTADSTLIIGANGDYYTGSIRGPGNSTGIRTGGAIITQDQFGPGSYEVRMKMMPRIGACNAIWTYYYENDNVNHEIDIEAPGSHNGEYSLENTLYTSWTGVSGGQYNTTYNANSNFGLGANNDGNWHTYRFDWQTNPKRVDWYIDEVLVNSTTANVPTYWARFWVGVWFPNAWCGTPDFERDYMLVDWVRITPFDSTGSTNKAMSKPSSGNSSSYPTSPVALPLNNLISTPGFEGAAAAWTVSSTAAIDSSNALSGTKSMKITNGGTATQIINGVYANFNLNFSGYAKASGGSATIKIEYLNYSNGVISSETVMEISSAAYANLTKSLKAPNGCKKIRITLSTSAGATCYFDDLTLRLA